jgi:hypothetical protein
VKLFAHGGKYADNCGNSFPSQEETRKPDETQKHPVSSKEDRV